MKAESDNNMKLYVSENIDNIAKNIRLYAHNVHSDVNQKYDDKPYGFHLDMVVENIRKYGGLVCKNEEYVLPILFGGYFHDSIEDARLTYNDVMKIAKTFMTDSQAFDATEIVYALTDEKGRNRKERANEKYYEGIRNTPYASFVKLADRLANISYSFSHKNESNLQMQKVYREELPNFIESITPHHENDIRFVLPKQMIEEIKEIVSK